MFRQFGRLWWLAATLFMTTSAMAQNAPDYTEAVAPILAANCVSCHRADGSAPMALTTYEEAGGMAVAIRDAVVSRRMPPWHAEGEKGVFQHDPRLTDADVAAVAAWADAGAPHGEGAPPSLASILDPASEWVFGEPDLILQPDAGYEVGAEGDDEYRCFVMRNPSTADRWVRASDIRPGAADVVHHVMVWIDSGTAAMQRDAADARSGYSCFGGPGFQPAGSLGVWLPGQAKAVLPEGVAYFLPANSSLVMQVHYHKHGHAVSDRTRIGLYYADGEQRALRDIPVLNFQFQIPAGAPAYEVRAQWTVPEDIDVISILPHMHLLGQSMEVTATLPGGEVLHLIRVSDYDFNWQRTYTYVTPVLLPRGARVDLLAVFDNSAANPNNPNSPPRPVRFGEATTDEMAVAYISYTVR